MNDFQSIGKYFLLIGGIVFFIGIAITFWDKIPLLGKMPGDIIYKGKNFTVYFPIVTSIILSIIISLIIYLLKK